MQLTSFLARFFPSLNQATGSSSPQSPTHTKSFGDVLSQATPVFHSKSGNTHNSLKNAGVLTSEPLAFANHSAVQNLLVGSNASVTTNDVLQVIDSLSRLSKQDLQSLSSLLNAQHDVSGNNPFEGLLSLIKVVNSGALAGAIQGTITLSGNSPQTAASSDLITTQTQIGEQPLQELLKLLQTMPGVSDALSRLSQHEALAQLPDDAVSPSNEAPNASTAVSLSYRNSSPSPTVANPSGDEVTDFALPAGVVANLLREFQLQLHQLIQPSATKSVPGVEVVATDALHSSVSIDLKSDATSSGDDPLQTLLRQIAAALGMPVTQLQIVQTPNTAISSSDQTESSTVSPWDSASNAPSVTEHNHAEVLRSLSLAQSLETNDVADSPLSSNTHLPIAHSDSTQAHSTSIDSDSKTVSTDTLSHPSGKLNSDTQKTTAGSVPIPEAMLASSDLGAPIENVKSSATDSYSRAASQLSGQDSSAHGSPYKIEAGSGLAVNTSPGAIDESTPLSQPSSSSTSSSIRIRVKLDAVQQPPSSNAVAHTGIAGSTTASTAAKINALAEVLQRLGDEGVVTASIRVELSADDIKNALSTETGNSAKSAGSILNSPIDFNGEQQAHVSSSSFARASAEEGIASFVRAVDGGERTRDFQGNRNAMFRPAQDKVLPSLFEKDSAAPSTLVGGGSFATNDEGLQATYHSAEVLSDARSIDQFLRSARRDAALNLSELSTESKATSPSEVAQTQVATATTTKSADRETNGLDKAASAKINYSAEEATSGISGAENTADTGATVFPSSDRKSQAEYLRTKQQNEHGTHRVGEQSSLATVSHNEARKQSIIGFSNDTNAPEHSIHATGQASDTGSHIQSVEVGTTTSDLFDVNSALGQSSLAHDLSNSTSLLSEGLEQAANVGSSEFETQPDSSHHTSSVNDDEGKPLRSGVHNLERKGQHADVLRATLATESGSPHLHSTTKHKSDWPAHATKRTANSDDAAIVTANPETVVEVLSASNQRMSVAPTAMSSGRKLSSVSSTDASVSGVHQALAMSQQTVSSVATKADNRIDLAGRVLEQQEYRSVESATTSSGNATENNESSDDRQSTTSNHDTSASGQPMTMSQHNSTNSTGFSLANTTVTPSVNAPQVIPMTHGQQIAFGVGMPQTPTVMRAGMDNAQTNPMRVFRIPIDQFAANTSAIVRQFDGVQGGSAKLILSPEALGTVVVNLNLQESQRSLSIEVSSDHARETVQSQMPQLHEQLAAQGVRVDSVSVTVRQNDAAMQSSSQNQQQSSQQRQEDREARSAFLKSFDQQHRSPLDSEGRSRQGSQRQHRGAPAQRRSAKQAFELYA